MDRKSITVFKNGHNSKTEKEAEIYVGIILSTEQM